MRVVLAVRFMLSFAVFEYGQEVLWRELNSPPSRASIMRVDSRTVESA